MSCSRNPHSPLAMPGGHPIDPARAPSKHFKHRTIYKRPSLFCTCVLAAGMAQFAPAHAHDLWLSSIEHADPGNGDLRVGLLIGEHTGVEAMPFNPDRVERLWLTTTDGAQEITVTSPQVALPASADGDGSRTLAYISKPASSVLPAAKFDEYLREEHLQSILLQRQSTAKNAASSDDSSMVSERYSRSLKMLLSDAGQPLIDCPVGLPLELSLVAVDDTEVVVQATFRGQPLAGVWIDRGAPDGSALPGGVSDANGRIALIRSDGDWVVRTTHMLADDERAAEWRSWWATTAFRLTPAGVSSCVAAAK